ncbi:hypothetical protein AB4097_09910 [Microvirga sp. 2MCAF35]|uniref:hypothetical protein n=1 Tax=Microvirga sp. 2MCAF35 TaxID=3232987 RepID=UPI003F9DBA17
MSEEIDQDRRRFRSAAAITVASAELAMMGSAEAQSSPGAASDLRAIGPSTNTSFGGRWV